MNSNHKKLFQYSALVVAIASASAGASAATLEEVVVTAQKREQGVNDVGITVNAFSGETIREMGVASAEDIAMLTPGLTVNETAATGVPAYTIRGVGFQDYTTSSSSTVGLYFDEVAIPYTVMSRGAIFDVQRVEVLKGPQGDLYGRNTTAGQINFVSNKPTEEFSAGISTTIANFGVVEAEGHVSGSLSEGVRGRVAFKTTQSSEGWQKSLTRDDELGEKDVTAVRALLDIDLNDAATLSLNVHYVDDQSDNKANTAYDGRDAGLGQFSAPHLPLDQYIIPGGDFFEQTPPFYSTGDNRAADWTNSYTSEETGKTWNLRPRRDNQLFGGSAKLEWDLGDMTLTSLTAYDKFERAEANDWDGGAYNDSSNINTTDLEVFSQEIRLSGGDESFNWIVGAYYSSDEMEEYYHYFMSDSVYANAAAPFGVGLFAPTPIKELDTKYSQETDSQAIFAHTEWQFAENWRLTTGVRWTNEERTWTGCTFVAEDDTLGNFLEAQFPVALSPGACGTVPDANPEFIGLLLAGFEVDGEMVSPEQVAAYFQPYTDTIDEDNVMWKLGIDHSLSEDVLVYGTYSVGYKSGGFNGANSNTTLQLIPIKEEKLTSLEVGFKATLLEGSMQLNGALFQYDYEDKQEQDRAVALVGNISGLTNVPESEITGAELDMQWSPAEGWMINAGIAWLDTEITDWMAIDGAESSWTPDGSGVVRFDASGLELAQSPEWSYNLLAQYEWTLASGMVMRVAGDYVYQDSTTGGSQPTDATDAYWVANARIGLSSADGNWSALLWARNITDEYYFPAAYTGGNGPYVRSVGMPRTFGVTLNYNF